MDRLPDELLDYYGELYLKGNVFGRGVTFSRFLECAEYYIQLLGLGQAETTRRSVTSELYRRISGFFQKAILGTLIGFFVISCSKGSGPEAAANRFMDLYYVAVDLPGARRVAEGLAAKKIDDQLALTRGLPTGEARRGREISYQLMEKKGEDNHQFFLFDVLIKAKGEAPFTRKALIAVAKTGSDWRVTNFRDFD